MDRFIALILPEQSDITLSIVVSSIWQLLRLTIYSIPIKTLNGSTYINRPQIIRQFNMHETDKT